MNKFILPEESWPIEWGKEEGLYCYLEAIEELRKGRVLVKNRGEMIMLSSYSYLGLLDNQRINEAAIQAIKSFGTGTHGVRLLAGTISLHDELESRIAEFKHTDSAIVFSSGYIANLAAISAILQRDDVVLCDKLNHASIVEGCYLSGAKCYRFRHNDMDHLKSCLKNIDPKKNKLVVVDAAFSMDGDIINLPVVSKLCKEYGALLMVDEAHSLGVLGKTGTGIEEHFGLSHDTIDVKMGTFSKAIPGMGGFIASSNKLISFLKHNSPGFIFSASLAPPLVAVAIASLDILLTEPQHISRLHKNMEYFRTSLRKRGFNLLNTECAIMPIHCGEDIIAYKMAKLCQDKGIFIQGIPSPIVPKGTARLRAIVTAAHTQKDINYCIEVIYEAGKSLGLV